MPLGSTVPRKQMKARGSTLAPGWVHIPKVCSVTRSSCSLPEKGVQHPLTVRVPWKLMTQHTRKQAPQLSQPKKGNTTGEGREAKMQ